MLSVLYICDPDKNIECSKEGCMLCNYCKCTSKPEYAKTGQNGRPIVAVRSDTYGYDKWAIKQEGREIVQVKLNEDGANTEWDDGEREEGQ